MPDHYSLICGARNGDSHAFDVLMKRYERLVYKIVAPFAGTTDAALDLTQTVFLKAFSGLDSLGPESNFKAWLTRIAANEGINWRRRHGRHEGHESLVEEASQLACERPGPLRALGVKDEERQIQEGLERLRPRYRLAISLRYFQGLKVREIAEALECSEPMAKNLLFRGVRSLRQLIHGAAEPSSAREKG